MWRALQQEKEASHMSVFDRPLSTGKQRPLSATASALGLRLGKFRRLDSGWDEEEEPLQQQQQSQRPTQRSNAVDASRRERPTASKGRPQSVGGARTAPHARTTTSAAPKGLAATPTLVARLNARAASFRTRNDASAAAEASAMFRQRGNVFQVAPGRVRPGSALGIDALGSPPRGRGVVMATVLMQNAADLMAACRNPKRLVEESADYFDDRPTPVMVANNDDFVVDAQNPVPLPAEAAVEATGTEGSTELSLATPTPASDCSLAEDTFDVLIFDEPANGSTCSASTSASAAILIVPEAVPTSPECEGLLEKQETAAFDSALCDGDAEPPEKEDGGGPGDDENAPTSDRSPSTNDAAALMERLRTVFEVFDINHDGTIDAGEMHGGFFAAGVEFSEETVGALFATRFNGDDTSCVTFEDFQILAAEFPSTFEALYWKLRPASHARRLSREAKRSSIQEAQQPQQRQRERETSAPAVPRPVEATTDTAAVATDALRADDAQVTGASESLCDTKASCNTLAELNATSTSAHSDASPSLGSRRESAADARRRRSEMFSSTLWDDQTLPSSSEPQGTTPAKDDKTRFRVGSGFVRPLTAPATTKRGKPTATVLVDPVDAVPPSGQKPVNPDPLQHLRCRDDNFDVKQRVPATTEYLETIRRPVIAAQAMRAVSTLLAGTAEPSVSDVVERGKRQPMPGAALASATTTSSTASRLLIAAQARPASAPGVLSVAVASTPPRGGAGANSGSLFDFRYLPLRRTMPKRASLRSEANGSPDPEGCREEIFDRSAVRAEPLRPVSAIPHGSPAMRPQTVYTISSREYPAVFQDQRGGDDDAEAPKMSPHRSLSARSEWVSMAQARVRTSLALPSEDDGTAFHVAAAQLRRRSTAVAPVDADAAAAAAAIDGAANAAPQPPQPHLQQGGRAPSFLAELTLRPGWLRSNAAAERDAPRVLAEAHRITEIPSSGRVVLGVVVSKDSYVLTVTCSNDLNGLRGFHSFLRAVETKRSTNIVSAVVIRSLLRDKRLVESPRSYDPDREFFPKSDVEMLSEASHHASTLGRRTRRTTAEHEDLTPETLRLVRSPLGNDDEAGTTDPDATSSNDLDNDDVDDGDPDFADALMARSKRRSTRGDSPGADDATVALARTRLRSVFGGAGGGAGGARTAAVAVEAAYRRWAASRVRLERHAIVVCVTECGDPNVGTSPPVLLADAMRLVMAFRRFGYTVDLMQGSVSSSFLTPTLPNIMRVIRHVLRNSADTDSKTIVYVLSMGSVGSIRGITPGRARVALTQDSVLTRLNVKNALTPESLTSLVDACGNAPLVCFDVLALPNAPFASERPGCGFASITNGMNHPASMMFAVYPKHTAGLFSYYFLRGLEGFAAPKGLCEGSTMLPSAITSFVAPRLTRRGCAVATNAAEQPVGFGLMPERPFFTFSASLVSILLSYGSEESQPTATAAAAAAAPTTATPSVGPATPETTSELAMLSTGEPSLVSRSFTLTGTLIEISGEEATKAEGGGGTAPAAAAATTTTPDFLSSPTSTPTRVFVDSKVGAQNLLKKKQAETLETVCCNLHVLVRIGPDVKPTPYTNNEDAWWAKVALAIAKAIAPHEEEEEEAELRSPTNRSRTEGSDPRLDLAKASSAAVPVPNLAKRNSIVPRRFSHTLLVERQESLFGSLASAFAPPPTAPRPAPPSYRMVSAVPVWTSVFVEFRDCDELISSATRGDALFAELAALARTRAALVACIVPTALGASAAELSPVPSAALSPAPSVSLASASALRRVSLASPSGGPRVTVAPGGILGTSEKTSTAAQPAVRVVARSLGVGRIEVAVGTRAVFDIVVRELLNVPQAERIVRKPRGVYQEIRCGFMCSRRHARKLDRLYRTQALLPLAIVVSAAMDTHSASLHRMVTKIQALVRGLRQARRYRGQRAAFEEEAFARRELVRAEHNTMVANWDVYRRTTAEQMIGLETLRRAEHQQQHAWEWDDVLARAVTATRRLQALTRFALEQVEDLDVFVLSEWLPRHRMAAAFIGGMRALAALHRINVAAAQARYTIELAWYQHFLHVCNEWRQRFRLVFVVEAPVPPCTAFDNSSLFGHHANSAHGGEWDGGLSGEETARRRGARVLRKAMAHQREGGAEEGGQVDGGDARKAAAAVAAFASLFSPRAALSHEQEQQQDGTANADSAEAEKRRAAAAEAGAAFAWAAVVQPSRCVDAHSPAGTTSNVRTTTKAASSVPIDDDSDDGPHFDAAAAAEQWRQGARDRPAGPVWTASAGGGTARMAPRRAARNAEGGATVAGAGAATGSDPAAAAAARLAAAGLESSVPVLRWAEKKLPPGAIIVSPVPHSHGAPGSAGAGSPVGVARPDGSGAGVGAILPPRAALGGAGAVAQTFQSCSGAYFRSSGQELPSFLVVDGPRPSSASALHHERRSGEASLSPARGGASPQPRAGQSSPRKR